MEMHPITVHTASAPITLTVLDFGLDFEATDFSLVGTTLTITDSGIDHGSLSGLTDVADHAYAFLHNGTRAMTGNLTMSTNDILMSDDQFVGISGGPLLTFNSGVASEFTDDVIMDATLTVQGTSGIIIDNQDGGSDATLQMDGASGMPIIITYESDNLLLDFNRKIRVLGSQDSGFISLVDNPNTGTSAFAMWRASSDAVNTQIASFAAAFIGTRHGQSISGGGELLSNKNLFIGTTAGATQNIFFGTANTLAMTIDGSNQNITTQAGRIKNTTRYTTTQAIPVTDHEVFANTDGSAWTATLPTGVEGQTFRIINSGSSGNQLTIAVQAGEDLLGVTNDTFILNDGETLVVAFNATDGWY